MTRNLTRRQFVTGLTGGTVATLAGCSALAGGSPELTYEVTDEAHGATYVEGEWWLVISAEMLVTNEGDAAAENVTVTIEAFKDSAGNVVATKTKQVGNLEPGEKRSVSVEMRLNESQSKSATDKEYGNITVSHGE